VSGEVRFGRTDLSNRLRDMLAVFTRADCVLHPVDVSGLGDVLSASGATLGAVDAGVVDADHSTGRKEVLFRFAEETGGTLVEKSNDLAAGLASVSRKTSVVYVLAFSPARAEPGTYHELKVRVRRPGVRVSSRAGYWEPLPFAKRSTAEKRLSAAQLVAFGAARDELGTRVAAAAFPTRRGSVSQVPVLVEVPGDALVAGSPPGPLPVEVFAYLLDANLRVVDFATQVLTFDTKKVGEALRATGFKYYATLAAPPGAYTLRVLVRDATTGRSDVVPQALAVAAVDAAPRAVRPFFHEPVQGGWLRVRAPARPGLLDGEDEPFSAGGSAYVPAALPRLEPASSARLSLVAYRMPGESLAVTGAVLDVSGKRVMDAKVSLESAERPAAGARRLVISFSPEGLASGRYALALHVASGTAATDAPPAPFVVAR
jgi:hypothetical protein